MYCYSLVTALLQPCNECVFVMIGNVTSYQLLCMFRVWGLYVLRNLGLDKAAFQTVLCLFSCIQRMTYHSLTQQHIDQLLADTLKLMKMIETHMPLSERDIIVHLMCHIPAQLSNYGPARGFWCFGTERFFNHAKKVMKQRKSPGAHLMRITLKDNASVGQWSEQLIPEEMDQKYAIDSQVVIIPESKKILVEVDIQAMYELLFNTTPEEAFHGLYKQYKKYKQSRKAAHRSWLDYEVWLDEKVDQDTLTEQQKEYLAPFPTTAGESLTALLQPCYSPRHCLLTIICFVCLSYDW